MFPVENNKDRSRNSSENAAFSDIRNTFLQFAHQPSDVFLTRSDSCFTGEEEYSSVGGDVFVCNCDVFFITSAFFFQTLTIIAPLKLMCLYRISQAKKSLCKRIKERMVSCISSR